MSRELLAALSNFGHDLRAAWLPMTLATAVILGAAWLVDRLLARRVSAAWRLLLYMGVAGRLLLPAGWQSPLGLFPGSAGPPPPVFGEPVFVLVGPIGLAPGPSWDLGAWLALGYGLGALALLLRLAGARWRLRRLLHAATPLPSLMNGAPVWRHPTLGPCVAGLWRPRIVLPASLIDGPADAQARAFILRHELAHIQRRDPWLALALEVACALAWPVIPLWLATRQIRTLMEQACDERALAGADASARRRYGELLLALAEDHLAARLPAPLGPVLGFPALGSPLRARLRALGNSRRWPVALQGLVVAALGALALACGAESGDDIDASTDAGDASSLALHLDPTLAPNVGGTFSVPGYGPRFGTKPATGRPSMRLLEANLARTTEVQSTVATLSSTNVAADREVQARSRRLRQTAPWVQVHRDGNWLCSARGGCTRMSGWQSLETAIREALDDTRSRVLMVDLFPEAPQDRVREVTAAASVAGAEEIITGVMPMGSRKPPIEVPALRPGDAPVSVGNNNPVLSVTASGSLYLWKELVTPDELEAKLRRWVNHNQSRTLLIRGDRDTVLRSAVDVMAIAKRAGIANIGILEDARLRASASPSSKRGNLDKQIIRRVIDDHIDEVKACYEAQLRRPHYAGGTLRVMFTIGTTGAVDTVEIAESTWHDRPMNDCLTRAVRSWKFPPPEGGGVVAVNYPFKFAPKDDR